MDLGSFIWSLVFLAMFIWGVIILANAILIKPDKPTPSTIPRTIKEPISFIKGIKKKINK